MQVVRPVFRNPDKVQVLPFREWMRQNLPTGKQGMVVEDLDLLPTIFGPLAGRSYSDDGMFMLVELKTPGYSMSYGQKRLFGLIDTLLRFSDPHEKYYLGCFTVWWDHENNKPIAINFEPCTEEQFSLWMQGKERWLAHDFSKDRDVGKFVTRLHNSLKLPTEMSPTTW